MQNYINKVQIAGTVLKDTKSMEGKQACLKFTVMTKELVETPNKSFESATFHNIVIFGKEAEKYNKLISKDTWVEIEGSFSQNKFDGRYYMQVIAKKVSVKSTETKTRKNKKAA